MLYLFFFHVFPILIEWAQYVINYPVSSVSNVQIDLGEPKYEHSPFEKYFQIPPAGIFIFVKYFLLLNGFKIFLPPRCVIHQKRKHLEAGFVFLSRIMVKHFQKILTLNREWQSVARGHRIHWVWAKIISLIKRMFFKLSHLHSLCCSQIEKLAWSGELMLQD